MTIIDEMKEKGIDQHVIGAVPDMKGPVLKLFVVLDNFSTELFKEYQPQDHLKLREDGNKINSYAYQRLTGKTL